MLKKKKWKNKRLIDNQISAKEKYIKLDYEFIAEREMRL